jgi:V8-like Glu-specific endopeptidase
MRKICGVIALGVLAAAIAAPTAFASDNGYYPPSAPTPVRGSAPAKGQPTAVNRHSKSSLSNKFTGKRCAKAHKKTTCFYYKRGHLTKRCKTKGKTTTCTFYTKTNRPSKVCVHKRGHRPRCHKVKLRKTAQRAATARKALGLQAVVSPGAGKVGRRATLPNNFRSLQGLTGEGFGSDIPAVGAILLDGQPHCSGSLVANGIVLTAGHCVWDPKAGQYYSPDRLSFVPDETVLTDYGNLPWQPYGTFQVINAVTTQAFAGGDEGGDWGFMELAPDASGYQAGQYTGTWSIYQNVSPLGRAWLAGYPGEGIFSEPSYYAGYAQYHTDSTWDTYYLPTGWNSETSKPIILWQSKMTGGSSGGAVIEQLSDGTWAIGGVINIGFLHQCPDNSCRGNGTDYWGDWQGSVYFDSDISGFYQAMLTSFGLN